jgi:signal transduction histidine kinase
MLLASILVLGAGMYYELIVERRAAKSAHRRREPMQHAVLEIVLFYCIPCLVVASGGGWWIMRRALTPLDDLAGAAERIQLHNLRDPLPRPRTGDEIDRLSAVLASMTARLDEAFAQMCEFTLHASHELKTPLAVLHGELELCLQDPAATPAQKEVFASLLDEIQRLMKIVSGLAFLAKADAGLALAEDLPVPLHDLVADAVEDSRLLGQAQDIQVELTVGDEVWVKGDRHRLRQLVLNLADNAIKYNRPGGTVRWSVHRAGGEARLEVGNTGPGIPAEKLPRVFDRFYRGDSSHSRDVEGAGLGLAIARSIVLAHGGTLRADSEPGSWTTFRVTLPLAAVQSEGTTR